MHPAPSYLLFHSLNLFVPSTSVFTVTASLRCLAGLTSVSACLLAFRAALGAEDPFAAGVRPTDPLTPTEQQGKFKLPPGFEIQLVANEPDINKPMNLAFDATGRLWVTTSIEYPWAAPTNRPAQDRLMIFEDFGPDGRARKVTRFAEGLNIPTGVYPFRTADKHWKAVVWAIPNIWLLEDTDDDGKADKQERLYGPFDYTRDTHGNQSSFRRGFDGWLYCTHGYNNDSHVTAGDGSHVDLNSGNTYRIQLETSRIEQQTHGQVNPFGAAFDPRGNLYTSDCHSAPIYQLIAGGWYPSFGKPHDGLGYAPVLMEHAHGSTAIDGLSYYVDDLWPAEFNDNIFIGNVMTSRLNRDRLEFHGSTPKAIEQKDLLKSEDPWFRPVDTCLGPDGALYIADFYNRIIGHYEVPLVHPGRDRERGRLWRIVYRGIDGKSTLRNPGLPDDLGELIGELASPSQTRRMLAMNEIQDRFGAAAKDPLRKVLALPVNAFQHVHALWIEHRLGGLRVAELQDAMASSESLVRIHAQRIAGNLLYQAARRLPVPEDQVQGAQMGATAGLMDRDAHVQRAAVEALGYRPHPDTVRPLLNLLSKVPSDDTHLLYVVRKSLRDHLMNKDVFSWVLAQNKWSEADIRALADVTLAVKSEAAGTFLLRQLPLLETKRGLLSSALKHAAQYAPPSELEAIATFARRQFTEDLDFQLDLLASVDQGASQRGVTLSESLRVWGTELCGQALSVMPDSAWYNTPLETTTDASNPWAFQERRCADGQTATLLSSFPRSETFTGRLRSKPFAVPARFSFYLCGHDGEPDRPPEGHNVIQLRDAATGAVLVESAPPRNDTAQKITWDLAAHAGKQAVFEAVDGDNSDAWAWLAFGRFDPPVLALPSRAPGEIARRQQSAGDLVARLRLPVGPQVRAIALGQEFDTEARASAIRAFALLDRVAAPAALVPLVQDSAQPLRLREAVGLALLDSENSGARAQVVAAMKSVPYRLQVSWAQALASSAAGATALLDAVAAGAVPPRVLIERAVKDRLSAGKPAEIGTRLAKLTKDMPPTDRERERDRLVNRRRAAYATATVKLEAGEQVFLKNCAVCHQVEGKGALVGPQLSGIGTRGLERLCEDILDPNRNVDINFRTTVLTLKDGDTVSGLFRRAEGEQLVLADAVGKEFPVPKNSIREQTQTESSLMPDNFGDAITPEDFNALLAFLLSNRSATK
ncbi:MAG: c-type cytochrome [Pedosphaera sp.]|nr:c-type cytochrome [Pedosphaera sp.]